MIFSSITKLALISCVATQLLACGKKVVDEKAATEQETPALLPDAIEMSATSDATTSYRIPRNGHVTIPVEFGSFASTLRSHSLRLIVNVDNDGLEEFSCAWDYRGASYRFKHCLDPDGRDLGLNASNLGKFQHPIDKGLQLKLKFDNAGSGATLRGQITIPVNLWI